MTAIITFKLRKKSELVSLASYSEILDFMNKYVKSAEFSHKNVQNKD